MKIQFTLKVEDKFSKEIKRFKRKVFFLRCRMFVKKIFCTIFAPLINLIKHMKTKHIRVTDTDKAYQQYLKAFEETNGTTVNALQLMAFKLKIEKGNSVNVGNTTFKKPA